MPKSAPSSSCFGRSILIITPQRALKFTASSIERHHVWLTALSFLSHNGVDMLDATGPQTALPILSSNQARPPSVHSYRQVSSPAVPTLRRGRVRDSIRLAKGKERPNLEAKRAYTTPSRSTLSEQVVVNQVEGEDDGAAEAPQIPRRNREKRLLASKMKAEPSLKSKSSSAKGSLYSLRNRRDSTGETWVNSLVQTKELDRGSIVL